LAWSTELKPGRAYAARFAGEPIVLVRPKEGAVFALEDRCAHRQVPLSKGVVEGCALRCCYHGWTYDGSGQCIDVPYLGKGKLPNGVRAYPCREQDGLIFVWPGDTANVPPLPTLGAVADPAFKTRRFGQTVGCHYSFMHENLMDMNHQFLHRKQMGQIAPRYLGRRIGPGWLECDYTFARTGGRQPLGEAAILGRRGVSDKPRDLMTIRTEYPYQTLRIWTSGDEPVMHLCRSTRRSAPIGRSVCCRCGGPRSRSCWRWAGRYWYGSPIGSSARTARSSRWNRPRTTGRVPTGTKRCSR
jgi:phenylpropionate dioxygenase-like ring-hydroxylating dioxygenase large terminal subunit